MKRKSPLTATGKKEVMMTAIKRRRTPWAVICREHGQVFMTAEEYESQMFMPDSVWKCPLCGRKSEWDDDNHEAMERKASKK
jgi:hypothetical protein